MADTTFEVVVIAPVAGRYGVVLQSNCGRCRSARQSACAGGNDGADVLICVLICGARRHMDSRALNDGWNRMRRSVMWPRSTARKRCPNQGCQINAPFPLATSGTPVFLPTYDTGRR